MASRPKRTLRKPHCFCDEFAALVPSRCTSQPKQTKKDDALYEIDVSEVDRERKLVRIHYKGYESKFDEWRPYDRDGEYFPFIRQEKPHTLTTMSLEDRSHHFTDLLYRAIKRSLYSGRKDDPAVRLEVDVMEDAFNTVLGSVVDGVIERGRLVYNVPSNRKLDVVLGQKWDERIINFRGDYCFVAEGTVKFWLMKRSPIEGFNIIGGNTLKLKSRTASLLFLHFLRVFGTVNNMNRGVNCF